MDDLITFPLRHGRVEQVGSKPDSAATPFAESETSMFVHPLARSDQHLIQDFMLTKIVLLLAREADEAEWIFEMKSMDEKASGSETRENVFLFVYTVTRHHIAALRANAERSDAAERVSTVAPFLANFRDAVAANAPQHAHALWTPSAFGLESHVASPAIQRLAFEFLRLPSVPGADVVASSVADFLPDAYRSGAVAGEE
jgi:hypothetical protein